jgi:glycosyltransferase involved in cell wall biosynthesis
MGASQVEMTDRHLDRKASSIEEPGNALKISYLFSQFPLPTQSFAVSDIEALRTLGNTVFVHTLKPVGRDTTTGVRLTKGSSAFDFPVLRPGIGKALRWPAMLFRRRKQLFLLLGLIIPQVSRHPASALTALLCIPRALEIAEEIVQLRSDVVHLFWSRYAALVLPVLRNMGHPAALTTFVGAYDLVADDFVVRMAIDHADTAFSHAEVNRAFIEARAPSGLPIQIIHRGIPLAQSHGEPERDRALWVTASALVREKNVSAVLKAFARAREQAPELRLIVCGEGPDRPALELLARTLGCAEAISFAGHIERHELFELMHRAGAFLMLSRKPSERLPNVIKEALWSGCAVITSRSEGIEELIPDAGIGLVVAPDDEAAISAAVAEVLSETDGEAQARRDRARELIASRFSNVESMRKYVQQWLALRHSNGDWHSQN